MYLLEELFIDIALISKTETNEEVKQMVKEEIFDQVDNSYNSYPRRILIEGHPGYGKTTLLLKLLSDWSKGEAYIFHKFDMIFLILLRNYSGDLSKDLLEQCEGIKGTEEQKLKAIEDIEHRILLLLDGLDEVSPKIKRSLLSLLGGEKYSKMTVIVTCRTGLFSLETEVENDFEKMTINPVDRWDKKVQIKGISEERRSEFLQKYLKIEPQQLEEKLSNFLVIKDDFYECPLFLLLVAALFQEGKMTSIKTKTELYKTISNFVVNRSLNREKELEIEFNIFESNSQDIFHCRRVLINFGRLCLDKIKSHSLLFEEEELLQCSSADSDDEMLIIKMGFLSKQISLCNREKKENFQPVHGSFLEFFAAFYVSCLDEIKMEEEILELLLTFRIWPKEDQLLYPFLGGFLQSNAFKLFKAFYPCKDIISIFNIKNEDVYHVEEILLEISSTEKNLKFLAKLSPVNWENVEYRKSLHDWFIGILKIYHTAGKNELIQLKIPQHLVLISGLSEVITVNKVFVDINTYESIFSNVKLHTKKIHCLDFFLHSKGISPTFIPILKSITSMIKAKRIWLKIYYPHIAETHKQTEKEQLMSSEIENFNNFYKQLFQKDMEQFKLFYLTLEEISLQLFQVFHPLIIQLIAKDKIEYGLNLKFSYEEGSNLIMKEITSFGNYFSQHHLKSLELDIGSLNEYVIFPAGFFNHDKQWEFIRLDGLFSEWSIDEFNRLSVEHFNCTELIFEDKIFLIKLLLKMRAITTLTCNEDLVSDLSTFETTRVWKRLETVENLDIKIPSKRINDKNSFLMGISCFKNLRYIHLDYFRDSELFIKLISEVRSLIKISIDNCQPVNLMKKLLFVNNEEKKDKICLEELEVKLVLKLSSAKEFMMLLEECLSKKILLKFTISNSEICKLTELFLYFLLEKEFTSLSQLKKEEYKVDERLTLKSNLESNILLPYKFVITLKTDEIENDSNV